MADAIDTLVYPFVQRGLFTTTEQAVAEMAREYVLCQIEAYRRQIQIFEERYGMTYAQFGAYLQARSATLADHPDPTLNQAVIAEEEDALSWKIAQDMLLNWLGLQTEVHAWLRV